jgi:GNAT superfamily N-acetyltransferase
MGNLEYRFATLNDVPLLAEMNQQLIHDEKHRNRMVLPQLEKRMSDFLRAEYTAVIVSMGKENIGYALYRRDSDWIYLRQLFVKKEMRRRGIGRAIVEWLKNNPWKEFKIIRVEVLVDNLASLAFWKSVGFKDYCITMEMENQ